MVESRSGVKRAEVFLSAQSLLGRLGPRPFIARWTPSATPPFQNHASRPYVDIRVELLNQLDVCQQDPRSYNVNTGGIVELLGTDTEFGLAVTPVAIISHNSNACTLILTTSVNVSYIIC